MSVQTVCGPITQDSLGITLSHEHILIDRPFRSSEPEEASKKSMMNMRVRDLGIENLGMIRLDPMFVKDNLNLDEIDVALNELKEYRTMGGNSLVDVTLQGAGRNPAILKEISEKVGLNIVCGTGWYVKSTHPPMVKKCSVNQLCDIMVKELTEGIDNTGIKAGIIGELGCSQPAPFHPEERKVIKAAVLAQKKTGVCITIHPSLFDLKISRIIKTGHDCLDLLERQGFNPARFYLSHAGWVCQDLDYLIKLLDRGVTLSFDSFGSNADSQLNTLSVRYRKPCDAERIIAIVELCKMGYDKQIVVSQDICMKIHLKKYGGYGYSHILENVVPILRREGVSKKQVQKILVENPRNLLTH